MADKSAYQEIIDRYKPVFDFSRMFLTVYALWSLSALAVLSIPKDQLNFDYLLGVAPGVIAILGLTALATNKLLAVAAALVAERFGHRSLLGPGLLSIAFSMVVLVTLMSAVFSIMRIVTRAVH
ncbi:MAG: hypothetical protein J0I45_13720 [Bosea sp.]|nr:hypothetical protein [Bosea sp. (in: a-proteobacteria)]